MWDVVLGFFEGLVGDWLWRILGSGVAVMIGYLRLKQSRWISPIMYGLGGLALITLIQLGVTAQARLNEPTVTADSIQDTIRDWSLSFGYGVRQIESTDTHFVFDITTVNGIPFQAFRQHNQPFDELLTIQATIEFSDEESMILSRQPVNVINALIRELRIEMTRKDISYSNITNPLRRFTLTRSIPITNTLNQFQYLEAVQSVTNSIILARQVINLRVRLSAPMP